MNGPERITPEQLRAAMTDDDAMTANPDIVERLRDWPRITPVACREAADEIEHRRKHVAACDQTIVEQHREIERLRAEAEERADDIIEQAQKILRLETTNAELLAALEHISKWHLENGGPGDVARAAIAKAKATQK